eukprot:TRINITY_DN2979_c0_g6_i1.p1 TRINITY_DN2979_c0_g6~~TRINITY_DN2979_c0_g6_i1.p1  ORF type:complete len:205 (+),score=18.89 TRINITY_DN2979_c0_g6_i1:86-700(+)
MRKIKNMNLHPIANSLTHEYVFVDNELQESLKRLGFWSIFARHGVPGKRSGYPVRQVVFTLLVWVFLNQTSIRSFLGKFVGFFFDGGKDVLYDFLKREDINWRGVGMGLSKSVYSELNLDCEPETAFVVDDSIKQRRGKKSRRSIHSFRPYRGTLRYGTAGGSARSGLARRLCPGQWADLHRSKECPSFEPGFYRWTECGGKRL